MSKGNAARAPNQGERLNRQNLGRSYFFEGFSNRSQNHYDDIEYKSPNIGINKSSVHDYIGKAIQQPVFKGNSLTPSLFKNQILFTNQINFANINNISLPVSFMIMNLFLECYQ